MLRSMRYRPRTTTARRSVVVLTLSGTKEEPRVGYVSVGAVKVFDESIRLSSAGHGPRATATHSPYFAITFAFFADE
jgi:hypothetical protein